MSEENKELVLEQNPNTNVRFQTEGIKDVIFNVPSRIAITQIKRWAKKYKYKQE